jgi:hypothetical protein
MRWTDYEVYMGEMRSAYKVFVRKPEGRDYLEGIGIDGRIILKWILGKYDRKLRTEFNWRRIRTCGRLLRTR